MTIASIASARRSHTNRSRLPLATILQVAMVGSCLALGVFFLASRWTPTSPSPVPTASQRAPAAVRG